VNYRHAFHAGNFADVFKHLVLVALLEGLKRKEKGFAYFETHAGAGRYDLRDPAVQKTGEYRDGIARLWTEAVADPLVMAYLDTVRSVNCAPSLQVYPGSPRIARALVRPQDRIQLAELEPGECARLLREFARDRQVRVECGDGYGLLAAWLPAREGRGLVLIDPPYESAGEWHDAAAAALAAHRRWSTGIHAIWYPLKVGAPVPRLKQTLKGSGVRRILVAELEVWPGDTPFRLNGCGMAIINPPWQLDAELERVLPALAERLRQGPRAAARVEWLVPE
jgi:23S rRNA (adenine2030-N6)-methyltransferase